MPQWAKTFMLLTGMIAWLAIIGVSLWLKQIPSGIIIGFPAALWLALTGRSTIARKRARKKLTSKTDDTEGDGA